MKKYTSPLTMYQLRGYCIIHFTSLYCIYCCLLDSCTASYRQSSESVSIDAACRTSLGIGVAVPIAVLIVVNIISVVVVFLITRHCYKKTSQKSSPSKVEYVYEQVEGQNPCENIVMTDSPAYGPVEKGNKT